MAKLIFTAITSLDGYIEDAEGNIRWGAPDDEVGAFVNDLERPIGTYLYGRRMYETMLYWETAEEPDDLVSQEFTALWRAADKIVYSTTLEGVSSARTQLVREFDPAVVRAMKASADRDLNVSGPNLAAHAFRAGLVDECLLFVVPATVGGGKPALPIGLRQRFELLDERRFNSGVVLLHYRVAAIEDGDR